MTGRCKVARSMCGGCSPYAGEAAHRTDETSTASTSACSVSEAAAGHSGSDGNGHAGQSVSVLSQGPVLVAAYKSSAILLTPDEDDMVQHMVSLYLTGVWPIEPHAHINGALTQIVRHPRTFASVAYLHSMQPHAYIALPGQQVATHQHHGH